MDQPHQTATTETEDATDSHIAVFPRSVSVISLDSCVSMDVVMTPPAAMGKALPNTNPNAPMTEATTVSGTSRGRVNEPNVVYATDGPLVAFGSRGKSGASNIGLNGKGVNGGITSLIYRDHRSHNPRMSQEDQVAEELEGMSMYEGDEGGESRGQPHTPGGGDADGNGNANVNESHSSYLDIDRVQAQARVREDRKTTTMTFELKEEEEDSQRKTIMSTTSAEGVRRRKTGKGKGRRRRKDICHGELIRFCAYDKEGWSRERTTRKERKKKGGKSLSCVVGILRRGGGEIGIWREKLDSIPEGNDQELNGVNRSEPNETFCS